MSFWLYGRKQKCGRRYVYSVNAPLFVIIAVIGLLGALLMPLIQGCQKLINH